LRGTLSVEAFSDKPSKQLPKLKVYVDDQEVEVFGKQMNNLIAGTHSLKVLVENVERTRQIEIRPRSPLLVRYKIIREAPKKPQDNSNNADNVSF
jgi:hypothetical protein